MKLGMSGGGWSRGRPRARWVDEIMAIAAMTLQQAVGAYRDRVG